MLDVLTSLSDCRHETVEGIMERRISGVSYMCWMDSTTRFCVVGFMYPINIILLLLLFHGYHAEGYHAPSLPPRAITTVYESRLSRHSISLLLGYHTRAITLHYTRTSRYHTRHSSSYFVVYLSPAITPPILLHLHHHRGATRTNLLHTLADRSNEWAVRCCCLLYTSDAADE